MSKALYQVQEINYINHIGAWSRPEISADLGVIACSNKIHRKETITEDTVRLLQNYIYWAPIRRWPNNDWEYFYNYAMARLNRVRKTLAAKQKEGQGDQKIITTFGK